jgi:ABC-2 type transport system permease protein
LLEGRFKSPYANRLSKANEQALREDGLAFRKESEPTRMVVIADGDILSNPIVKNETLTMGYNIWERFTYANKPFILNTIEYLLNPEGVISARGKDVKLRLLDREAALADSVQWQSINIIAPLVLLGLFGLVFNLIRRRKYARKQVTK